VSIWMAMAAAAVVSQVPYTTSDCLECHGDKTLSMRGRDGSAVSLYVDSRAFAASVHGSLECTDCHGGVITIPHATRLPPVVCGACHDDVATSYQWHGFRKQTPGELMPACHDCHGTHDILAPSDPASTVNPVNLPRTCGRCHENPAIVGKYDIPMIRPVQVFERSVHSRRVAHGTRLAATCIDCHSRAGTAHAILSPNHPDSSINHFNIASTCGRCHPAIATRFERSVHGLAAAKGETDAPVCTSCHDYHDILPVRDPRSPVNPVRVSMTTCAPCHGRAELQRRYGLRTAIITSWRTSYHGLKSTDGDPRVANCASCHRAHQILSRADPESSVNPANVQKTCARCHPGMPAQLARIDIHGTEGVFLNPIGVVLRNIYIVAIVVIIGAMVVHWLIDLAKQIRLKNREIQVPRMTRGELWQHTLLMVTFTVLAITGFAFHSAGSWWVDLLFGWPGGFEARRLIHRVAAVLFILTAIWHVAYLLSGRGRRFMRDVAPRRRDFVQFSETMAYDLDLRSEPPRFGRFSYIEKAEYWALVWGTVVMSVTGLALWFSAITQAVFTIDALGVMLVVHRYEAILATLAIAIWHFYSTIFNPPVYPNNPSWYTGTMPLDMYRHEHPDDPVLRNYEDESS
jgi:cytochrome b subunit of formate dehydrogenase